MKIRAGIIGGAGYTGSELIRLLLHHPDVEIGFMHSRSNAGKAISTVHQDLLGETTLQFTDDLNMLTKEEIDVLFLCLGHGESKKFLLANDVTNKIRIIDLANDFRLANDSSFLADTEKKDVAPKQFIYGLPELNRASIKAATNIANPGCFATAIQLGLLPLAKAGLLNEVYTTGITGSTGAGQSLSQTSHFSWRANNIQAYKTLTHQHLGEIYQSLNQLHNASFDAQLPEFEINFVPWRGDFTRGIFVSSVLKSDLSLQELIPLYRNFYEGEPFTHISDEPIFLKQVVNTNKAVIQLEKAGSKLVVHSAIDNLLKGASGQAVQNMNLMFGLDEAEGLRLKANYF